jgi:hypothetical protein
MNHYLRFASQALIAGSPQRYCETTHCAFPLFGGGDYVPESELKQNIAILICSQETLADDCGYKRLCKSFVFNLYQYNQVAGSIPDEVNF